MKLLSFPIHSPFGLYWHVQSCSLSSLHITVIFTVWCHSFSSALMLWFLSWPLTWCETNSGYLSFIIMIIIIIIISSENNCLEFFKSNLITVWNFLLFLQLMCFTLLNRGTIQTFTWSITLSHRINACISLKRRENNLLLDHWPQCLSFQKPPWTPHRPLNSIFLVCPLTSLLFLSHTHFFSPLTFHLSLSFFLSFFFFLRPLSCDVMTSDKHHSGDGGIDGEEELGASICA